MNIDHARIENVLHELEVEQMELLTKIEMYSSHISLMKRTDDQQDIDREKSLLSMYKQAGVIMPDAIQKRFDDVRAFRESISKNRKVHLSDQVEDYQDKLGRCQQRLKTVKLLKRETVAMLARDGNEPVGVRGAIARLVEVPPYTLVESRS
jgi:uncharacterized protein YydD (DUF2326 family)